MTHLKKYMDRITSDYKKHKMVNGVSQDTYFFEIADGYGHPLFMRNAISYAATQKMGDYAYFEASLDTSREDPLFIFLEKFFVRREPVKLEKLPLDLTGQRDIYYLFHKKKDQIFLKKQIDLDDTFDFSEYIHVVLNERGELTKSEICRKEFDWSLEYIYDEKGLLIRIITKTADRGTFVQERGKDF